MAGRDRREAAAIVELPNVARRWKHANWRETRALSVDGYPNFRLATDEELIEVFGPEAFAIGFPVRPKDYTPPRDDARPSEGEPRQAGDAGPSPATA